MIRTMNPLLKIALLITLGTLAVPGWTDGGVSGDCDNGYGVWEFDSGARYEGDWVNGNRTGKGVYRWPNGESYEGHYLNNKRHGKGVYTWPNGARYEGDYVDNKRHGKGVHTFADGARYEGDWVKGEMHGMAKALIRRPISAMKGVSKTVISMGRAL